MVGAQNMCSVRSNLPEAVISEVIQYIENDESPGELFLAAIKYNDQRNTFSIWLKKYQEYPVGFKGYLECNQKRILIRNYSIPYFTEEEYYLDNLILCENCEISSGLLPYPYLFVEIEVKGLFKLGKIVDSYE